MKRYVRYMNGKQYTIEKPDDWSEPRKDKWTNKGGWWYKDDNDMLVQATPFVCP